MDASNTASPARAHISVGSNRYPWAALALLTFVGILASIDRQLPFVLAESIKGELQLSDGQLGLIGGTAFAVFYTALVLPLANLADKTSRRWVITSGVTLWSLLTVAMGHTSSFLQMFFSRAGVAAGEAACNSPSQAIITDAFPATRRATALAIYAVSAPIGAMIAFAAGGWIASQYGWRFTFILFGLIGLATALLTAISLPANQQRSNGGAEASMFITVRDILADPTVRSLIAAACLLAFIPQGVMAWLMPMIIRVHGSNAAEAGLIVGLPIGLAGSLGIIAGGIFSDRLGLKKGFSSLKLPAVALLMSTPLLLWAVLSDSVFIFVVASCIGMLLSAMPIGPTFACIQHLADPTRRATTTATVILISNLVGGLGPPVVGYASDLLRGAYQAESVRIAIAAVVMLYPLAAWLYLRAERALDARTEAP